LVVIVQGEAGAAGAAAGASAAGAAASSAKLNVGIARALSTASDNNDKRIITPKKFTYKPIKY
jgi:hypothetical protein